MVVGIPHPETVAFEANVPRRHELTLTFTRRSRDTLAEAVELAASGEVDLRSMPVRRFSLAETDAAIAATGERPRDMLRAVVVLG
jgi:threonine dehydrogenase-like Zn-dependent dehydrogenase